MDQLRTALVWLKRHHFWVLCGVVALIAVVSWAKASSKLTTLFNTNQSAIKAEFGNIAGLRKDPFHPNDEVNAKQAEQTAQQSADVKKLWQQLYDRQREHVLEWPKELSKDFRDYVDKLQFGADIRSDLRNHYQNYIEGHFPALPKKIDARAIEAGAVGTGPGGPEFSHARGPEGPGAGAPNELQDENDYICEWAAADQNLVREDLNFRDQPTPLRIWVTQENLWVYETLLDVIAKTNHAAGATRMSNAAVQYVGELSVGWRAAKGSHTSGRLLVKPPVAAAAAPGEAPGTTGPAMGPEGGPGGRAEFSPERAGPGGGVMTEEAERSYLLSGRYLDPQGKPLTLGGGGGAAPGDPSAPAPAADAGAGQPLDLTAFGQEYKRLPVRMVLRMDQRWLPRLISECAGEPLQVEVQEVRINPPEATGIAAGGPGGAGSYRPGEGGAGGNANVFQDEPAVQPFPTQPQIVNVLIQGTIYIFNKPNPAILQIPGEQPAGATPVAAAVQ